MPSRIFTPNSFYHIYNRGVDKRNIFLTEEDYLRFQYSLSIFNTRNENGTIAFQLRNRRPDNNLVAMHAFCLMPNHFHLLVSSESEDGISMFMHKVGLSYTHYFNKHYHRSGRLFENVYKSKQISDENYLLAITKYIHLNPLSLASVPWKNGVATEHKTKATRVLTEYPW
jgi:putative transposase